MGRKRQFEKNDTYVRLENEFIKKYKTYSLYQVYGVMGNR